MISIREMRPGAIHFELFGSTNSNEEHHDKICGHLSSREQSCRLNAKKERGRGHLDLVPEYVRNETVWHTPSVEDEAVLEPTKTALGFEGQ